MHEPCREPELRHLFFLGRRWKQKGRVFDAVGDASLTDRHRLHGRVDRVASDATVASHGHQEDLLAALLLCQTSAVDQQHPTVEAVEPDPHLSFRHAINHLADHLAGPHVGRRLDLADVPRAFAYVLQEALCLPLLHCEWHQVGVLHLAFEQQARRILLPQAFDRLLALAVI